MKKYTDIGKCLTGREIMDRCHSEHKLNLSGERGMSLIFMDFHIAVLTGSRQQHSLTVAEGGL